MTEVNVFFFLRLPEWMLCFLALTFLLIFGFGIPRQCGPVCFHDSGYSFLWTRLDVEGFQLQRLTKAVSCGSACPSL
jgi:hypothetical protein